MVNVVRSSSSSSTSSTGSTEERRGAGNGGVDAAAAAPSALGGGSATNLPVPGPLAGGPMQAANSLVHPANTGGGASAPGQPPRPARRPPPPPPRGNASRSFLHGGYGSRAGQAGGAANDGASQGASGTGPGQAADTVSHAGSETSGPAGDPTTPPASGSNRRKRPGWRTAFGRFWSRFRGRSWEPRSSGRRPHGPAGTQASGSLVGSRRSHVDSHSPGSPSGSVAGGPVDSHAGDPVGAEDDRASLRSGAGSHAGGASGASVRSVSVRSQSPSRAGTPGDDDAASHASGPVRGDSPVNEVERPGSAGSNRRPSAPWRQRFQRFWNRLRGREQQPRSNDGRSQSAGSGHGRGSVAGSSRRSHGVSHPGGASESVVGDDGNNAGAVGGAGVDRVGDDSDSWETVTTGSESTELANLDDFHDIGDDSNEEEDDLALGAFQRRGALRRDSNSSDEDGLGGAHGNVAAGGNGVLEAGAHGGPDAASAGAPGARAAAVGYGPVLVPQTPELRARWLVAVAAFNTVAARRGMLPIEIPDMPELGVMDDEEEVEPDILEGLDDHIPGEAQVQVPEPVVPPGGMGAALQEQIDAEDVVAVAQLLRMARQHGANNGAAVNNAAQAPGPGPAQGPVAGPVPGPVPVQGPVGGPVPAPVPVPAPAPVAGPAQAPVLAPAVAMQGANQAADNQQNVQPQDVQQQDVQQQDVQQQDVQQQDEANQPENNQPQNNGEVEQGALGGPVLGDDAEEVVLEEQPLLGPGAIPETMDPLGAPDSSDSEEEADIRAGLDDHIPGAAQVQIPQPVGFTEEELREQLRVLLQQEDSIGIARLLRAARAQGIILDVGGNGAAQAPVMQDDPAVNEAGAQDEGQGAIGGAEQAEASDEPVPADGVEEPIVAAQAMPLYELAGEGEPQAAGPAGAALEPQGAGGEQQQLADDPAPVDAGQPEDAAPQEEPQPGAPSDQPPAPASPVRPGTPPMAQRPVLLQPGAADQPAAADEAGAVGGVSLQRLAQDQLFRPENLKFVTVEDITGYRVFYFEDGDGATGSLRETASGPVISDVTAGGDVIQLLFLTRAMMDDFTLEAVGDVLTSDEFNQLVTRAGDSITATPVTGAFVLELDSSNPDGIVVRDIGHGGIVATEALEALRATVDEFYQESRTHEDANA